MRCAAGGWNTRGILRRYFSRTETNILLSCASPRERYTMSASLTCLRRYKRIDEGTMKSRLNRPLRSEYIPDMERLAPGELKVFPQKVEEEETLTDRLKSMQAKMVSQRQHIVKNYEDIVAHRRRVLTHVPSTNINQVLGGEAKPFKLVRSATFLTEIGSSRTRVDQNAAEGEKSDRKGWFSERGEGYIPVGDIDGDNLKAVPTNAVLRNASELLEELRKGSSAALENVLDRIETRDRTLRSRRTGCSGAHTVENIDEFAYNDENMSNSSGDISEVFEKLFDLEETELQSDAIDRRVHSRRQNHRETSSALKSSVTASDIQRKKCVAGATGSTLRTSRYSLLLQQVAGKNALRNPARTLGITKEALQALDNYNDAVKKWGNVVDSAQLADIQRGVSTAPPRQRAATTASHRSDSGLTPQSARHSKRARSAWGKVNNQLHRILEESRSHANDSSDDSFSSSTAPEPPLQKLCEIGREDDVLISGYTKKVMKPEMEMALSKNSLSKTNVTQMSCMQRSTHRAIARQRAWNDFYRKHEELPHIPRLRAPSIARQARSEIVKLSARDATDERSMQHSLSAMASNVSELKAYREKVQDRFEKLTTYVRNEQINANLAMKKTLDKIEDVRDDMFLTKYNAIKVKDVNWKRAWENMAKDLESEFREKAYRDRLLKRREWFQQFCETHASLLEECENVAIQRAVTASDSMLSPLRRRQNGVLDHEPDQLVLSRKYRMAQGIQRILELLRVVLEENADASPDTFFRIAGKMRHGHLLCPEVQHVLSTLLEHFNVTGRSWMDFLKQNSVPMLPQMSGKGSERFRVALKSTRSRRSLFSRTSSRQGSFSSSTPGRPQLPLRTSSRQGSFGSSTPDRPQLPLRTSSRQGSFSSSAPGRPQLPL